MYDDESCNLAGLLGLKYISILLQLPGKAIKASRLLHLAGGLPSRLSKNAQDSMLEDLSPGEEREYSNADSGQNDSSDVAYDGTAKAQAEARLMEIESRITSIGKDSPESLRLLDEYDAIDSHLRRSSNRWHRARPLHDPNEKARVNITKALDRAVKKIESQGASETARHLRKFIKRGSEFEYRDTSSDWKVLTHAQRRPPQ